VAPRVAGALAAVGEFDRALACADRVLHKEYVFGQAALSAARYLDRASARPFVHDAARRLAAIAAADYRYTGEADIAEALARIGDTEGARRTALSIQGPTQPQAGLANGAPWALYHVAKAQREKGDLVGAKATLREAHRYVLGHRQSPRYESDLNMVSQGLLDCGDLDEAVRIAQSLPAERRHRLLPLIAWAQAVSGDRKAAATTMAQARVEAPGADQARRDPSWRAEAARAEFLAQAGDTAAARATVGGIGDEFYRAMALGRVAAARTAAGDVAGALRLALEGAQSDAERREALQGLGQGIAVRWQLESVLTPAK
jgi:hypothetical protein